MSDDSSWLSLAGILRDALKRYPVGGKLPSSRTLVDRHKVSPATVSRAVAALAAEGLVVARPGAGVFRAAPVRSTVSHGDVSWQEVALGASVGRGPHSVDATAVLAQLTDQPADVINLTTGYLHSTLQPEAALAAALARAGRRPGVWTRPPTQGIPELRAWFARQIAGDAVELTADHIVITSGGQSALSVAVRALVSPGAPVLVESPSYPGLLAVLRAAGARPVPVPMDDDGLRPDLLVDAFASTGARLLVCQPTSQNPTGTTWPWPRRSAVLAATRRAGAFLVEDDFARLLTHSDHSEPPPPMATADPDGVVVHIRSLTKPISPTLRIAGLSARGPALERIRALHAIDQFFVPRPLQEAALELVSGPAWPRHLRTLAVGLRARRDTALAAVREHLPEIDPPVAPHAGFHLWLRLPHRVDEARLAVTTLRAGVAVAPGRHYFAADAPAPHVRLTYVAPPTREQIVDGVRRLAVALDRL